MLEKFGPQTEFMCLISSLVPICILEKLTPSVLSVWVDVLHPEVVCPHEPLSRLEFTQG